MKKRFREAGLQVVLALVMAAVIMTPVFIAGGFNLFLSGFLLRFLGTSGVTQSRTYNVLYAVFGLEFNGVPPIAPIGTATVVALYLFETRSHGYQTTQSHITLLAQWSVIGAIVLNLFSSSEPQWLSWLVPLGITYGVLTGRTGLQYYTYFYGIASTFLIMTLAQSTGYVQTGIPIYLLANLEGYTNELGVYALTVLSLLLFMLGYVLLKPRRFRFEIVVVTILIYLQAYFWLAIVQIVKVPY